ncbi:Uncharacterised protein [Chlamydia trachomatis]|nr:Uncharacterised protein [Chlamydia trachomatis]
MPVDSKIYFASLVLLFNLICITLSKTSLSLMNFSKFFNCDKSVIHLSDFRSFVIYSANSGFAFNNHLL